MKSKTYTVDNVEKNRIMEQLSDILKSRDKILFAYVHGSFISGLPFHDLDIAVYLADGTVQSVTLDTLDLSQKISDSVGIPVDVRALNFAPIPFRYQAIRGTLLFERDENLLADVIEHTVQRYLDIEPLLRAGTKEAFAA